MVGSQLIALDIVCIVHFNHIQTNADIAEWILNRCVLMEQEQSAVVIQSKEAVDSGADALSNGS